MAKEVKEKKDKNHFSKNFKAELKKVIWPTPKQLANSTIAVIAIVLITAILVFGLDFAFEKLNTHGIDKLRNVVEKDASNETNDITNTMIEDVNTIENMVENTIDNTTENNISE